jgi:hypothetical protein
LEEPTLSFLAIWACPTHQLPSQTHKAAYQNFLPLFGPSLDATPNLASNSQLHLITSPSAAALGAYLLA